MSDHRWFSWLGNYIKMQIIVLDFWKFRFLIYEALKIINIHSHSQHVYNTISIELSIV